MIRDIIFLMSLIVASLKDNEITQDEEKEIINLFKIVMDKYLKISNALKAIILNDVIISFVLRVVKRIFVKELSGLNERVKAVIFLISTLAVALQDGSITKEERERLLKEAREALTKFISNKEIIDIILSDAVLGFFIEMVKLLLRKI